MSSSNLRSALGRLSLTSFGLVVALSVGLTPVPAARAADTYWTGSSSSDWSTAGNWSAGVPTSADNAQLFSGFPSTISLSGAGVANQLQVAAGANYTLGPAVLSGTLTLSDQLYLFSDATNRSSLTIGSAGGMLSVSSPNGSMGTSPGTAGSTLTVTGGTTTVAIAGGFNVGYSGTGNILAVQPGASFTAGTLTLGADTTASGNQLLVSGGAVTTTTALQIGASGAANVVTASAGSITVQGGLGTEVGTNATAVNNMIDLAGATFSSTSSLIVGRDGGNNSFQVRNGSIATTGQARIGLNSGADGNSATVSGTGSQWTANGTVRVGSGGSSNQLLVASGGTMAVAGVGNNLWIGYGGAAGSNTVTVTGSGSVLDVTAIGAEVVVSGSTSGIDNLLVLNNGGYANVNSIQVGPGGAVIFGSNVSPGPGTASAGGIKGTATINGNGIVGASVRFTHTDANFVLPNVMSGPLEVSNETTGTTTLTGANTYTDRTLISQGTLALGPTGSIASSSIIGLSGGTFDVSAVSGGYQLASGQLLTGDGTVTGPVTTAVGSNVDAGDTTDFGLLTVNGGLTILGNLGVTYGGGTVDLIDASGSAVTLGPGAHVTFNQKSSILPSGDLIFLKYLSLSGVFGTVTGLPAGYSIDYNYLGGNQIALVAGVPVPEIDPAAAGSVLALVGGLLGLVERRRRRS